MIDVSALSQEDVDNCPVRQVLSRVTGKWQMLIMMSLTNGPQRFGALKRSIGDVTQRVLTENLRKLERDGYVSRTVDPGPPVSVTYALTEMGQDLTVPLGGLIGWAAAHHADVNIARAAFDEATQK